MCGVAGLFNVAGDLPPPDRALALRMAGMLRHRGPDGGGLYRDRHVALAHSRLSIIDLGGGWQPMADADEQVWVCANNEIFNYLELRDELRARGRRFRTQSDTEAACIVPRVDLDARAPHERPVGVRVVGRRAGGSSCRAIAPHPALSGPSAACCLPPRSGRCLDPGPALPSPTASRVAHILGPVAPLSRSATCSAPPCDRGLRCRPPVPRATHRCWPMFLYPLPAEPADYRARERASPACVTGSSGRAAAAARDFPVVSTFVRPLSACVLAIAPPRRPAAHLLGGVRGRRVRRDRLPARGGGRAGHRARLGGVRRCRHRRRVPRRGVARRGAAPAHRPRTALRAGAAGARERLPGGADRRGRRQFSPLRPFREDRVRRFLSPPEQATPLLLARLYLPRPLAVAHLSLQVFLRKNSRPRDLFSRPPGGTDSGSSSCSHPSCGPLGHRRLRLRDLPPISRRSARWRARTHRDRDPAPGYLLRRRATACSWPSRSRGAFRSSIRGEDRLALPTPKLAVLRRSGPSALRDASRKASERRSSPTGRRWEPSSRRIRPTTRGCSTRGPARRRGVNPTPSASVASPRHRCPGADTATRWPLRAACSSSWPRLVGGARLRPAPPPIWASRWTAAAIELGMPR